MVQYWHLSYCELSVGLALSFLRPLYRSTESPLKSLGLQVVLLTELLAKTKVSYLLIQCFWQLQELPSAHHNLVELGYPL
jgi:hypothetical protein